MTTTKDSPPSTTRVTFGLRKDLYTRLKELATHQGAMTFLLNFAVESFLNRDDLQDLLGPVFGRGLPKNPRR